MEVVAAAVVAAVLEVVGVLLVLLVLQLANFAARLVSPYMNER